MTDISKLRASRAARAATPYRFAIHRRQAPRAHPMQPLIWGGLGIILPLYWLTAIVWFTEAVF